MSEKKKILIRIGSLRHGGAEKALVNFLKNIPDQYYEIDLLLNLYSGKYLKEIPSWINVIYLNKGEMITTNRPQDIPQKVYRKLYQGFFQKYPKALYNTKLKSKKYDVELIANHALFDEMIKSPITTSKKVVWIHSDIFHEAEDLQAFRKYFEADQIWVISESIKNNFEQIAKNQQEKNKIVKIYNPIDSNEIISKAAKPINYTFDPNTKTIIAIGTVYPAKGFDRLLRVHKQLIDENLPHQLLILGDGYDFENIKKLRDQLELQNTAHLLGFVDNPYPFLQKSDFFVLSSRYEGFPTVVAEAVILQKPIIATDISGVRDILLNEKIGAICENTEESLYQNVKNFLENDTIPNGFVEEIRQTQLPFTLEKSVSSLLENLDRL